MYFWWINKLNLYFWFAFEDFGELKLVMALNVQHNWQPFHDFQIEPRKILMLALSFPFSLSCYFILKKYKSPTELKKSRTKKKCERKMNAPSRNGNFSPFLFTAVNRSVLMEIALPFTSSLDGWTFSFLNSCHFLFRLCHFMWRFFFRSFLHSLRKKRDVLGTWQKSCALLLCSRFVFNARINGLRLTKLALLSFNATRNVNFSAQ